MMLHPPRISGALSVAAVGLLGLVLLAAIGGCRQEPPEKAPAPDGEGATVDPGPRRDREPPGPEPSDRAEAGPDTSGLSVPGADTLAAEASGADSLRGLSRGAPSMGPEDAAVTIVEFSDFECPFCTQVHSSIRQLMRNRPHVRLVYMQYPILSLHPKAWISAEASVEAQRQGKFWELHDALFEHGPPLDRDTVLRLGEEVGMDATALRKALDERTHRARVQREVDIGEGLGISGTPTFFINGYRMVGALPYERFVTIYNLLLRASRREEIAEAPASP